MEAPYIVRVEVISQKGTCSFGHRVGDAAIFDGQDIQGKICWHALCSMTPKIHAMLYGAVFPWAKEDPDAITHACPDASNPVVFRLVRSKVG